MQKYLTECRPFEEVRPGDLIGFGYGFVRVELIEMTRGEDGRDKVTVYPESQPAATFDSANWPDVVVGFTPEYRAAYPEESFEGTVTVERVGSNRRGREEQRPNHQPTRERPMSAEKKPLQNWDELLHNLEAWMHHYQRWADTTNPIVDKLPAVKVRAREKARRIDKVLTELCNLDN